MDNALKEKESIQSVQYRWPDKNLLLIEDDEISAFLIKEILVDSGLEITTCHNFEELLKLKVMQKEYHLIILNIVTHNEFSIHIFNQIKQALPHVPVILTSSIPYQLLGNKVPEINGFIKQLLLKPLKVDDLIHAIDSHIL